MKKTWRELKGTPGFIRVGQADDGVWWFLDPNDQPFFAKASAGVNRAGTQGGRLAKDGPYASTVDEKYGYPHSPGPFVDEVHRRLKSWGFNAHGAWVTEEFFDRGLLYTDIIESKLQVPECNLQFPGCKLPDVFDPRYVEGVEKICARLCPPRRDRKEFLGYFTDNEMGWGEGSTDHVWGGGDELNAAGGAPTLLQICLGLDPDRPACREAWRFIHERYDSTLSLAEAWALPSAGPEDFQKLLQDQVMLDSEAYGRDLRAFVTHFAHTYLRVTGEAIRRHDPNHLVLGCRFGAPPGPGVSQAVRESDFIDVVSANNYRDTMRHRMNEYSQAMCKPIFIGEYSWASDYHTKIFDHDTDPRLQNLSARERAAVKGRAALEEAFADPMVVGYTWYRWIQNPRKGGDFSDQGYGLVDEADEPNSFNVNLLTQLNPRAEDIHAGTIPATPVPNILDELEVRPVSKAAP